MPQATNPHIVMLHKAYPPWMGGIERHVRDVSEALAERGWRVTALVCNDKNQALDERKHGVRIVRAPRLGSVLSQPITWNYSRILRSLNADIIHVHTPFPLGWRAVLSAPKSIPALCTWHSDIIRQQALMTVLHPFEQAFLRRCSNIIATSPELLASSAPLANHQGKCVVIPLALPPEPGQDAEPSRQQIQIWKTRFPKKLALFVGRLVGYKGLPDLIAAMATVDADLAIAGNGPLFESMKKQTARLSYANRIHFLGEVSELEKKALYQCADVFVLPSRLRSEAFGYVLLEAMREGCPVITCDIASGVRWVNQHNKTGLVVPANDPSGLASAINQLLNDERLRAQFSENAKNRVESEFRFCDTIERLETMYRAVAASMSI